MNKRYTCILALAILLATLLTTAPAHATGPLYPANIEHDQLGYGTFVQSNLTNPNITGVDINMNWSDVEPAQDSFNWTPLDSEATAWAGAGKQIVLVVRYASSIHNSMGCTGAGSIQYLPAWEAARVPTLCSAGGDILPDYFDAGFQTDVTAYLSAIVQHVAASPYVASLAYIRIGVGVAGEGYPCVNCNSTNNAQLAAWGYSPHNWAMWQEQMLTAWQPLVSGVTAAPLIYPLGDNTKDTVTGTTIAQEVGYWSAARGIGVGQEGLHNVSGYVSGAAVKIMQYVRAHYPADYIQFQTVKQITGNYSSPLTEVNGDITIARSAGAFSIEWYGPDAANSTLQASFASWQQYVNCTYSGICQQQ